MPEDRYHRGLAAEASIADNLLLGSHGRPPASKGGLLDMTAVNRRARDLVTRFGIRTSDPSRPARTLSGGNAQRVVIAREFDQPRPLIVAAQPTRGIDIAASEFVRSEILRRRNEGAGVLLISADLAEILSLADRIVVLYRGRIVGELAGAEATEMNVGLLMAGVRPRGVDEPPDLAVRRARSRRGAGCDRADRRPGTSMSVSTALDRAARWDARGVLVAVLVPIVAIALALAIGGFVVILAARIRGRPTSSCSAARSGRRATSPQRSLAASRS